MNDQHHEFSYERYDQFGEQCVKVTAYNGNRVEVKIPQMLDGLKVTCIGEGAFKGNQRMSSVEIPPFVTAIDKEAFCDCIELVQILIPGSVKYIGDHAFRGCRKLGRMRMPISVTKLGREVFKECTSLTLLADEYSTAETYAKKCGVSVEHPIMYPPVYDKKKERAGESK